MSDNMCRTSLLIDFYQAKQQDNDGKAGLPGFILHGLCPRDLLDGEHDLALLGHHGRGAARGQPLPVPGPVWRHGGVSGLHMDYRSKHGHQIRLFPLCHHLQPDLLL